MAEFLMEIDLDTEDDLRQAVIDAAFQYCEMTRAFRDNLQECAPSWGVKPPGGFMLLHSAIDALIAFKSQQEAPRG